MANTRKITNQYKNKNFAIFKIMIELGKYKHFKGNLYEVIGIAKHSETLEDIVVYKALYGGQGLWVRPASMWNEDMEYNGKIVKRFQKVEE